MVYFLCTFHVFVFAILSVRGEVALVVHAACPLLKTECGPKRLSEYASTSFVECGLHGSCIPAERAAWLQRLPFDRNNAEATSRFTRAVLHESSHETNRSERVRGNFEYILWHAFYATSMHAVCLCDAGWTGPLCTKKSEHDHEERVRWPLESVLSADTWWKRKWPGATVEEAQSAVLTTLRPEYGGLLVRVVWYDTSNLAEIAGVVHAAASTRHLTLVMIVPPCRESTSVDAADDSQE
jgi:hypothetical protein